MKIGTSKKLEGISLDICELDEEPGYALISKEDFIKLGRKTDK